MPEQSKDQKKTIETLILSDLHLGLNLSRTDKIAEVIESYHFKRLILNGDIFDDLNFKRLRSGHWEILSKVRKLSKTTEVIWINGNHDGAAIFLSHLLGIKVFDKYIWQTGDKRYLAIHGHQFDRFLSENKFISDLAVWLYILARKYEGKNKTITNWARARSKSYLRMSEEVARGAVAFAKLRKCQYVFCGHTHLPKALELDGIKYYNSGCCVDIPLSYITITADEINLINLR